MPTENSKTGLLNRADCGGINSAASEAEATSTMTNAESGAGNGADTWPALSVCRRWTSEAS